MAIAITIVSTKGGVGKTTLTANLGGLLADLGQRVLLVDADAQPTHLIQLLPHYANGRNGSDSLDHPNRGGRYDQSNQY